MFHKWIAFAYLAFAYHGFANVVSSQSNNFNVTTSGLDYVTVHSSEVLKPGSMSFGLFLNHGVNVLPYFDEEQTEHRQSRTRYNDSLTIADAVIGVGLFKNLELGVSFPHIVSQEVDGSSDHGEFTSTGNTEVRAGAKLRVFGHRFGGVAIIGSANFPRTRNNPYTGNSSGQTYNAELATDLHFGEFSIAFNGGYRWSPATAEEVDEFPIEPMGDQVIASLGASYLLTSIDTRLITELYGARPAEQTDDKTDRKLSSLEWIGGAKVNINPETSLSTGLGTEALHGVSSPDWRAYAGISYQLDPFASAPREQKQIVQRKPYVPKQTAQKRPYTPKQAAQPTPRKPRKHMTPPTMKIERRGSGVQAVVLADLLFEFNSNKLTAQSERHLRNIGNYVSKKSKDHIIIVEGHTCSIGKAAYNRRLSRSRAVAIRNWLVKNKRVADENLASIGFGETRPVASNQTRHGRRNNRRVVFRFEPLASVKDATISRRGSKRQGGR